MHKKNKWGIVLSIHADKTSDYHPMKRELQGKSNKYKYGSERRDCGIFSGLLVKAERECE